MTGFKKFLWLEGIFDEKSVSSFLAISPAANFWQKGFVEALHELGHEVDVIGYPVERAWPFGRLMVGNNMASLLPGLKGKVVGYLNFPFFRDTVQYFNMLKVVKSFFGNSENMPDYQMIWSCLEKATDTTPAIKMAKYIRNKYGIPWICIVADGSAPPGADGYVYLAWNYYHSTASPGPSMYIDGGVPDVKSANDQFLAVNNFSLKRSLMYMGDLGPHGGVTQLARVFNKVNSDDIQLWICGRGNNAELAQLAEIDSRIKIKGFVDSKELNQLASATFAFVNPRPNSFLPNKLNYPSKLLHYLAFGKPVISTFTDGVSPDYAEILIPIRDESDDALCEAIDRTMKIDVNEYEAIRDRIERFNKTHTWAYQVNRFVLWLKNEKI